MSGEDQGTQPQTKKQEKDRWKDIRWMAWVSMIAGCLFPMLVVVTNSKGLSGLAMPFYTFLGAVVGVYVGFSTWEGKWRE